MLTLVKDLGVNNNHKSIAEYTCDCGDINIYIKTVVDNGRKHLCKKCVFDEIKEKKSKERDTKFIGKNFNNWTVIEFVKIDKNRQAVYKCKCKCGSVYDVLAGSLISNKSKQCIKCSARDTNNKTSHFNDKSADDMKIYRTWKGIKSRCYSGHNSRYYKDQGVYVCDEWKNDFKSFYDWAMNNGYDDTMEIDKDIICDELKISPKYYSPETCLCVPKSINARYSSTKDLVIKEKMRKDILGCKNG